MAPLGPLPQSTRAPRHLASHHSGRHFSHGLHAVASTLQSHTRAMPPRPTRRCTALAPLLGWKRPSMKIGETHISRAPVDHHRKLHGTPGATIVGGKEPRSYLRASAIRGGIGCGWGTSRRRGHDCNRRRWGVSREHCSAHRRIPIVTAMPNADPRSHHWFVKVNVHDGAPIRISRPISGVRPRISSRVEHSS